MNPGTVMNLANGASLLWIVLAGLFSLAVTIAWLYLAYRAVKAHERLAAAAELMSRVSTRPASTPLL
ncbi:MAG: hypothetical protein ABW186_15895 [Rhodanobacteraceae bacterium]